MNLLTNGRDKVSILLAGISYFVIVFIASPVIKGGVRSYPKGIPLWELPIGTYKTKTKETGVTCGIYCLQLELPDGQIFNGYLDKYSDLCTQPTSYIKWDGYKARVRDKCE
ncbi:hypothetical protein Ava_B0135 (plasmid) [Trichormus variabilis ATCC 29413]|uniref:Uncharacterized protein n=2 Tax=Anabaena variabilis TaxID=264691 RepID=Q3M2D9_TRIV2|nr:MULTISPECIES: hypothetical protein [Nostocaceae]ABA24847.1 hypothetical protein Ava_B0135 [Trichormus variabilis ATCC 29413]MBC1218086.1 hypothetical protein [Trichormus variabilis ARAD]MBC1259339.1 hypothetical protein [Trichormus variabilis V5]MBC1270871.1 hypothetical protein [Trichormus variabilis FSR]MBC1305738.1 hypothetical protein [Trichormus variabilis N2B]